MDSDESDIKQLKCTFYLNRKCNLEVTSIITINNIAFLSARRSCTLHVKRYLSWTLFLSVCYFTIMFKLCYKCPCSIPSLLHIHCLQCTYINLIVTVMVIQVDNDWSFVDPSFAYFFEWTHLLSARNDRAYLSLIGLGTALVIFLNYFMYYHYYY